MQATAATATIIRRIVNRTRGRRMALPASLNTRSPVPRSTIVPGSTVRAYYGSSVMVLAPAVRATLGARDELRRADMSRTFASIIAQTHPFLPASVGRVVVDALAR